MKYEVYRVIDDEPCIWGTWTNPVSLGIAMYELGLQWMGKVIIMEVQNEAEHDPQMAAR